MDIERRYACITGASRGIGRGIAERLAMEGYELFLICHKDVSSLSGLPGRHYAGDVGDFGFVSQVVSEMPRIDVLINNAGISWYGLLQDMTPEEWDAVIRTNLSSLYNSCHAVIPWMVHEKKGKIVNISSIWGTAGASMEVAYSASKGGVNAFTRALAKELAPSHIQVNAVACGVIDTDMNKIFSEEERLSLIEAIPAGRMGLPSDAAELVSCLINGNDYLTGQIITLDGGYL